MPAINNVFNSNFTNVSSSATINMGCSINVNPEAHSKSVGGAQQVGDEYINVAGASNVFVDSDVIDGLPDLF